MKGKIIVSDPGDEVTHIYECSQPGVKEVVPSEGAIEQQEGSNTDPSYMNAYD